MHTRCILQQVSQLDNTRSATIRSGAHLCSSSEQRVGVTASGMVSSQCSKLQCWNRWLSRDGGPDSRAVHMMSVTRWCRMLLKGYCSTSCKHLGSASAQHAHCCHDRLHWARLCRAPSNTKPAGAKLYCVVCQLYMELVKGVSSARDDEPEVLMTPWVQRGKERCWRQHDLTEMHKPER